MSPSGACSFCGVGVGGGPGSGFAGDASFPAFSAGAPAIGPLAGCFVSLSWARGLDGAGAGEGAEDGEVGTVGAGAGAISALGTTGSVASADGAAINLANTNPARAIVPICLTQIMSNHIPLLMEYSAIRDQRSPDQGTENDEDKSRAEIRFSHYLMIQPKMRRLGPTAERVPSTGETNVVRTMKLDGIIFRRHPSR